MNGCMNSRQNMQTTTVPPKPANAPRAPNGQVSQTVTCPPTSSGMTGMTYPASRSRRTTSWLATAMAQEQWSTHKRGTSSNVATRTAPIDTPTAIAAGKLRPARDAFFAAGSSGGVPASASVVATDLVAERSLDLQQLAFFVLDKLIDLGDVLVGGLVQILFRAADLVLTGLAVLADPVQLFHRLATNIAHRHAGFLPLVLGLLDQLPATFLGQLRHRHPDKGGVGGGVHPE